MITLKRSVHSMFICLLTAGVLGISSGKAHAQGHGGGGGHFAGSFAGHGYGGYGGYGYGGRGYGYGGYGWGWGGFGWGLGLGLGAGYYGWPYYGYPYYPYYGSPSPYPYPAYPYPGYAGLGPNPNAPPNPVAPAGGVISNDVTLMIRTPAEATIWINGVKSTQTGTSREFVSSGLAQGRSYTFDVRAEWTGSDGKFMSLERRVPVQAGERRLIDFTLPSP